MAFQVVFTKKAERDFNVILDYIADEFGESAAHRFRVLTIDFLSVLISFPELGIVNTPFNNIRSFVVHKRLKVIYSIKGQKIRILRLFDTRQHPDIA